MLTWTRRLTALSAGLAAIPAVAGCTVPSAGTTGISVTADGQPVGVILMCHDHIDGASLHPDDDDPETRDDTGRWGRVEPLTGFSTWPLATDTDGAADGATDGAADGWTAEEPLGALDPKKTYRMYGWTTDHSWASASVSFTLADLTNLRPGQVRYEIGDEVRTTSVDDFRRTACDDF